MCGIAGIIGTGGRRAELAAMVAAQRHRGPDGEGIHFDPTGIAGLGHRRLSIIDLSPAAAQPMADASGRLWIAFNGEIYNYRELRAELGGYPFRSQSDTEVLLAAYDRWGDRCLDRLIGMFAFLIWDERTRTLFAARDRFGVKPLYYARDAAGTVRLASEIRALHASGIPAVPDEVTWATYLTHGLHDHAGRTFWRDIAALPAGHALRWRDGELTTWCWYDLAERVAAQDDARNEDQCREELLALLAENVRLRFRSDVPVGINLSGGLDSSLLLGLVQAVQGADSDVKAFTYITGDARYDELPWVRQLLAHTRHPLSVCPLAPADVPDLAASVQSFQSEPCGGLPNLAYARLFEQARAAGVTVLLDGQGMDEQWAGYDYYRDPSPAAPRHVQGTTTRTTRPECLVPDFRRRAEPFAPPQPFPDRLRNLQYRDVRYTKLPRSLRFNDRVSMRASAELRDPFLDHRLFELAFRQPADRKIRDGVHKWLPRRLARQLLPGELVEAPKRPLQTPQREWLRTELRVWADDCIEAALSHHGGTWLDPPAVRQQWDAYQRGESDNSFYIWQWISLGLMHG